MAFLETLELISFMGFLLAAVMAIKSYHATKSATNVWLLFSLGFALFASGNLAAFLGSSKEGLAILAALVKDSVFLAGTAVLFSAMAVYYKEKRVCKRVCKKTADGAELDRQIRTFADGL